MIINVSDEKVTENKKKSREGNKQNL